MVAGPVSGDDAAACGQSVRRVPEDGPPHETTWQASATGPTLHCEHVVYESSQFRAGIRAPAVGKSGWQNRPHDGLRDPAAPGRSFTPNEKYATLVEACGYVPVALSGDDYVELLPSLWRVVNDYGIKIKRRTYDSPALTGLRRQHSGVKEKKGLWEVHHDPYDISRIWVRDHHTGSGWIEATWKHLNRVPVPFGELAWDHAAQGLPEATETEIADAVAALLAKAHAGSGQPAKPKRAARDKRVVARTRATGPTTPAPVAPTDSGPPAPEVPGEDTESLAEVIPLGLFNPLEDPWRRT